MSEAATAGLVRLFSDEKLTRRAVRGDERAFAAIFRRYHQSLYRFCLAIVGNPEDAQEALQNTMIKVLRALPGEERSIDLKPWLYRIAHNESIDLLRRRRETRELDVEQVAPGYGLAEDAEARERLRALIADLKQLPERQRQVLVMRELSGLRFGDIATALGTSGEVARQTLYEARRSLRQMEEGREMSCAAVTRALSDGDGRVTRRRDLRAHLRSCPGCRAFGEEIKRRQRDLAALSPLPAAVALGILHGSLGGSPGGAGGGLAATLGGGAAKTIGASAVTKGLATAAVVAAIGVTAADRTGTIHLGLPGEKGAVTVEPAPAGAKPGAAEAAGGSSGESPARLEVGGGGSGARPAGASAAPVAVPPSGGHAIDLRHGSRGGRVSGAPDELPGYGPRAEHPSGKDHPKQHPPAAAKGQEVSAAHQPAPHESGRADGSQGGNGGGSPGGNRGGSSDGNRGGSSDGNRGGSSDGNGNAHGKHAAAPVPSPPKPLSAAEPVAAEPSYGSGKPENLPAP
jgi:RNA polymerase sigma factor (sigma-70 family)